MSQELHLTIERKVFLTWLNNSKMFVSRVKRYRSGLYYDTLYENFVLFIVCNRVLEGRFQIYESIIYYIVCSFEYYI